MKKRYISTAFRVIFSLSILTYFIYIVSVKYGTLGEGLRSFMRTLEDIDLSWAIPAFLLHFVGISLMSYRWKTLLNALGFRSKYFSLWLFNLMAAFFNNFLPSTIGGDIIKGVESKKFTGDKTTAFTVIAVERLTGMAALVIISLSALLMKYAGTGSGNSTGSGKFILIIFGGIALFIIVSVPKINKRLIDLAGKLLPEKISGVISKIFNALGKFYKKPVSLIKALLISTVFQFNMVLYYFFISKSIGMDPGFIDFMIKAPLLIFLLMTLPSVNGLGVRTAAFNTLMKFPLSSALAVEAVDLLLRMLLGLIGGGVYMFYKREEKGRE